MRLGIWLLCLFFTYSLCAGPLEMELTARSAILMNAETGAILYEKNAHVPSYPASTTKIATALFVLDQKRPPLTQMVTVSGESLKMKSPKNLSEAPAYWQESDGTKMGLLKGEIVSLDTLLHGLLLVSGNDAANVLAESQSGSIVQFLEEMNAYVKSLGCQNTQFLNPHGLHHPSHISTAYDICLITKKALQVPKFRDLVSTLSYLKPKTNKQPQGELKQHNPLVKPGRHYYPKAIGVKTGYHSAAGHNLVAAAEQEGRTLIAVVLGCDTRSARYEEATRLFEAAFREQKERRLLVGLETIFTQEIEGSKNAMKAALIEEVAIEFYPAEEPQVKAFVHWDIPHLPIRKGQKVGEIRVTDSHEKLIQKGDLIALQEVKGTYLFVLKEKLSQWFR